MNIVLGVFLAGAIIFILPQWRSEKSAVSVYEEVHLESPLRSLDDAQQSLKVEDQILPSRKSESSIEWKTPEGWVEELARGMRVVTFKNKSNPDEIDCSIVFLGPQAGGLKENLLRWAGQIQVEISDSQLAEFIKNKTIWKAKEGQEIEVFDFSMLTETEDDTPSMIASIIATDSSTVFIKMTGTKDAILRNKKSFQELNESLIHLP